MSVGPIPLVAVGTLSGNLPTGAGAKTLGAPALAPGASFNPVGLDESKALTGVTLNRFATPVVSADKPASFAEQLVLSQQKNLS
ncbi:MULTISPECIES: hypothetical protein [Burkholderiaceae]|jgi:hypothetical protein|uniref:hypothetical protein n=1 Tax=Burkholderiaceae TaxID=119060 RepID=UPI000AA06C50|nr:MULTISPECIES: hypothetical protein [Burkholderiaceae]USX10694.1 hypothetical protein NHH62_29230 [Paraburkholderia fungorum]